MSSRRGFITLILTCLGLSAVAAQAPVKAATPCMTDANARKFDFWVGEWDVMPASALGTIVGHSVVQVVSGGCALLENWTATNGGEGKSLNTYNAGTGQWQQFWVGQQGVTEYRESRWDNGTLVFLAHSLSPQGAYDQRLSFTPVDANTVRQLGELSTDGGATWKVGYDFYYHRKR